MEIPSSALDFAPLYATKKDKKQTIAKLGNFCGRNFF
jgi:hypothetical protein